MLSVTVLDKIKLNCFYCICKFDKLFFEIDVKKASTDPKNISESLNVSQAVCNLQAMYSLLVHFN